MNFFTGLFNKKAVIRKSDLATGITEISPEFQSVNVANHAITEVIANDPAIIPYNCTINEFDGKSYECAVRQDGTFIFHDTEFEVLPVTEVDKN